jgi:hypothetical protein
MKTNGTVTAPNLIEAASSDKELPFVWYHSYVVVSCLIKGMNVYMTKRTFPSCISYDETVAACSERRRFVASLSKFATNIASLCVLHEARGVGCIEGILQQSVHCGLHAVNWKYVPTTRRAGNR